jgi:hypothetical protein
MPERGDQRPLVNRFLRTFFLRDTHSHRWPDEPDEPISEGDDNAQNHSLAQGKAMRSRGKWDSRGSLVGSRFHYAVIVTGS